MIDIRPTLQAKSDQLNADDLIGGPMTITITDVRLLDAADQPVAVHWEGGDGRPFKPCKSMRRVMAKVWGEDGKAFIGQRMTLYRDDKVRFGSDAVGGIRISHMSGIDGETTMALMVTRGKRAPYTVRPLAGVPSRPAAVDMAQVLAAGRQAAERGATTLQAWWGGLTPAQKAAAKPTLESELKPAAAAADRPPAVDDFGDMPTHDSETGEIIEAELAGHDDEPEDEGFPGDREASTDTFDVKAWARGLIADETRLTTVEEIEGFFADKEATRRYRALEDADGAMAKTLVAALNGRKKAAASKARG